MSKIEEIAELEADKICQTLGLFVYDVEYKKEGSDMCLRIFIDKEGGVTLDELEALSRRLSDRLDEIDPIKVAYELEVSSPGIERMLKRDWHFEKAIGKKVAAKLFGSIDGKKEIVGILLGADELTFTIDVNGKPMQIEKQKATSIKTVFEF